MNVAIPSPTAPKPVTLITPEEANPLQILGFTLLQGFVFLSCSRLSDLYLAPLHLPFIFSTLALIFMLLSGGLWRAASTTPARLLLAFTAWMVFVLPFSIWKGGSWGMLRDDWSRAISTFLVVAGLTVTLSNCRRIMGAVLLGTTTAGLIALLKNHRPGGRLALPVGLFSNSNDMAQMMLFALPLTALFWGKGVFKSLLSVASFGILLLVVLGSGSRSALLAIGVLLLLVFIRSSATHRLLIVIAAMVAAMMAIAIVPRSTLMRYATIFGGSSDVQIAESEEDAASLTRTASALESSESRRKLFFRSLELTVRNPIFGVGPGVFQVAASDLSQERGERSMWLETHNAYTQVSSETGIIGAVLYIGVVITCFRSIIRLERESRKHKSLLELTRMCQAMLFALTSFAVTAFFSSIAYKFMFPMILAVAVALVRAGQFRLQTEARNAPASDAAESPSGPRRRPFRPSWGAPKFRPTR